MHCIRARPFFCPPFVSRVLPPTPAFRLPFTLTFKASVSQSPIVSGLETGLNFWPDR
jgi:hypothetical protein